MDRFDFYLGLASLAFAALFVILALLVRRQLGAPARRPSRRPWGVLTEVNSSAPMLTAQAAGFAALGASRLIDYGRGSEPLGALLGLVGTLLLVAPLPLGLVIARRRGRHA